MKIYRPAYILLTASVVLLSSLASSLAALPNILWIVTEDINPQLGCYGDLNARTPNLDDFAKRSLRFRNCWSTAPVCAPARTTLITGVYPTSTGAEHMRSLVAMPSLMRMYPQFLRERGYYCVNNNKEDYNLEKPEGVWNESSKRAHYKNRKPGQPFFAAFNIGITHESQIRTPDHKLKTDPAKLHLPKYHPDTPEVRRDWAQYYDNIATMDGIVGDYLKELDREGLSESTIVFFFGDNGAGMPRHKRWPYNSGLSVPLIVHIPEKFKYLAPSDYKAGGESTRLVGFVDFAPTLLSLGGVKAPAWMQGSAFMGRLAKPASEYLYGFRGRMDERYDLVRSVRDERYLYIRNYMPHLIYGQYLAYQFETTTTRVWQSLYLQGKLKPPQTAFWETKPVEELYDLQADPDEVQNLVESPAHQDTLKRLRKAQREQIVKTRDLGFLPEAERSRRCSEITPYEFAQDPKRYPLEKILAIASEASSVKTSAIPILKQAFTDPEAGVRYWAAMGALMRGTNAIAAMRPELCAALDDESSSVRIVAAQCLVMCGDREKSKALKVLGELAAPNPKQSFVAVEALNAIDALGAKADSLLPVIKAMPRIEKTKTERTSGYVPRLLDHMLEKGQ